MQHIKRILIMAFYNIKTMEVFKSSIDYLEHKRLKAAQQFCDVFCSVKGTNKVVLTIDDFNLICNPNLQIHEFKKTHHCPDLTKCIFEFIRRRLMGPNYRDYTG